MDKKLKHQVRAVKPMNKPKRAIDWPLASPSTLGKDAALVYSRAASGRPLDRDLFDDRKFRGYVSRQEADSYEPSERILAAIAEIEAVGLGSYSPGSKFLYLTRVSEHYTVAEGRGSQLIRVYLKDEESLERVLLAVLVGGDIESRNDNRGSGMSELTVRARHESATDVEHDASSTALLTVAAPSFPIFAGYGQMSFTGFLTDANLYPLGTDPLTQEDFDPSKLCTICSEPHPYAPYLPPQVELPLSRRGTVVEVECLPLRPYLVSAAAVVD